MVSTQAIILFSCNSSQFFKIWNYFLPKGITVSSDELKKKIKSIRQTFANELIKMKKSEEESSDGEIYTPKLIWFQTAMFFAEHLNTRKVEESVKILLYSVIFENFQNVCSIYKYPLQKFGPLSFPLYPLQNIYPIFYVNSHFENFVFIL